MVVCQNNTCGIVFQSRLKDNLGICDCTRLTTLTDQLFTNNVVCAVQKQYPELFMIEVFKDRQQNFKRICSFGYFEDVCPNRCPSSPSQFQCGHDRDGLCFSYSLKFRKFLY